MLSDTPSHDEVVIACDPYALTPDQMKQWMEDIAPRLYKLVEEIKELPDGYAWRLPNDAEVLMLIAEDINMERLCCPFVRYTLEAEPNHGSFWYKMTGGEGVKDFLRMTFESTNLFDEQVAKSAGFNVSASKSLDSLEGVLETVDKINTQYASEMQGRSEA